MRQLITRISDELHTHLKAKAKAEGRSVNAIVTEAIEGAVEGQLTPQQELRRRAAELGILAEIEPLEGPPTMTREELIESTRGLGPFMAEYLERERRTGW